MPWNLVGNIKGPEGDPGTTSWSGLTDRPTVIAAGATQSDARTAIGAASEAELDAKEPTINAGTTGQYWRGDKSWQALDKSAVGLSSVDNTADAAKSVLYAASAGSATDSTKVPTSRTVNGHQLSADVTVTKSDIGLGAVDNTADSAKSVASAATLATSRAVRTNLASTSTDSFNGSADINPGVTGILPVSNGGTGLTTVTGLVKGNGTSAMSAAAAGTDYVAPDGALGTPSSGTLTNCTFPTLNQNTTGSAATLTTARTIDGKSFDGSANIVTLAAQIAAPATYVTGNYYFCSSAQTTSTGSNLGNGNARVSAWMVVTSVTIIRLFAEFTAAGEANSVFRIGIWNDDGTNRPGTLALDAGTISTGSGNAGTVATGGTPGVYEITVSKALSPGLYWVGGAVQAAPSSQPTIRTTTTTWFASPLGTSLPSANQQSQVLQFAQSGAFTTASSITPAGGGPRIGFKVS